jgi:hypothetical protein
MRTLRFGIEIETVGQTRAAVCEAIRSVVGGTVRQGGGPTCYDAWEVVDATGRVWRAVADSSLSADHARQAEVVSPILTYDDIPRLQEVVRAVRACGAHTDSTCGIHVHVDGARFDAKALRNLVKIVHKQEDLIEHALGVTAARQMRWCRGVDQGFLARIEARRPRTLTELNTAWYGHHNPAPQHYDYTRYRGLNLHSVWFRGTIEYRWFNGTLHAGKVKAYVQFALALAAKALTSRAASSRRRTYDPASAKYDFRCFLLGLGMIGDEFKTARLHLLDGLPGSAAWKHGRPEPERIAA